MTSLEYDRIKKMSVKYSCNEMLVIRVWQSIGLCSMDELESEMKRIAG